MHYTNHGIWLSSVGVCIKRGEWIPKGAGASFLLRPSFSQKPVQLSLLPESSCPHRPHTRGSSRAPTAEKGVMRQRLRQMLFLRKITFGSIDIWHFGMNTEKIWDNMWENEQLSLKHCYSTGQECKCSTVALWLNLKEINKLDDRQMDRQLDR